MTRIAIVGTGYVGLVTGACLASLGHDVTCADVDAARVEAIRRGAVPFFEPGLDELLVKTLGTSLAITTDLKQAVSVSDVTFIAVGTPGDDEGAIDLSQVLAAASAVGEVLSTIERSHIVVIKSTVVPGSTERSITGAIEEGAGRPIGENLAVVVNPEFLTEGTALDDFLHPDRIVVGSTDPAAARQVAELFGSDPSLPVIVTNLGTAEMIKYASNTLLSTLISFSNQIADIGSAIGDVDAAGVMEGVRLSRYLTTDGRTAPIAAFLEAGCGFGGSCLPKDTAALASAGEEAKAGVEILRSVLEVNTRRPQQLLRLVLDSYPDLTGREVAVLGLAFKPDTDDVRKSPAFPFMSLLLDHGARVRTHDPVVMVDSIPVALRSRVRHFADLSAAIADADVVVLVTKWDEYAKLPELLVDRDTQPLVVDGRRMLDPRSVARYDGIGYAKVTE